MPETSRSFTPISQPTGFPTARPSKAAVHRTPRLRILALAALCSAGASVNADSVKPFRFGPYVLNDVNLSAYPFGSGYGLTNAYYRFQIGWMEPLNAGVGGLFHETYFEANGNLDISPFQACMGTTFNFKPIRYWEIGLSYNRLLFLGSMASFVDSGVVAPPAEMWRPGAVANGSSRETGGADVFTYQTNVTVDVRRLQFFVSASRSLWDVDAKEKDFVYEYGNDLLIRPQDRVNSLLFQLMLDTRPFSETRFFTYAGFAVRDQYWNTSHTELEKNLISAGISGFRLGKNSGKQKRGLDLSLGYWTLHDQIRAGDWTESLIILADWKLNLQFLNL